MCLGSGTSAQKREAFENYELSYWAEIRRRKQIKRAMDKLNEVFNPFYKPEKLRERFDTAKEFYTDDVSNQKRDAAKALNYQLAQSGLSQSGVGSELQRKLATENIQGKQLAVNRAFDYRNDYLQRLDALKDTAKDQVESTAGGGADAAGLGSRLQLATAPQPYTPLGHVFSGLLTALSGMVNRRGQVGSETSGNIGYSGEPTGPYAYAPSGTRETVR